MSEPVRFTLRGRNPDVLTCIANLSNDEVFTPPEFASRMLDTLAEAWAADNNGANLWEDKSVRFLDPCTKSGVFLRVLKNSLARRAVSGTPFEKLGDQMIGPLIYGISNDPVATAKVLSDFAKSNDKFIIKGGAMPNAVISVAEVKSLANMPSRNELLSKLMGTMQAPIATFVRTLNEVPARFVRTVAAVRDAKQTA